MLLQGQKLLLVILLKYLRWIACYWRKCRLRVARKNIRCVMRCWEEVRECVIEVYVRIRVQQLIRLVICVRRIRKLASYVIRHIVLLHAL